MANIEEILAQCLSDLEGGDSVEDCLARYPERREELQPMLRAAQRVSTAPGVVPSASFRQHARARLMEKIDAQESASEDAGRLTWEGVLRHLGLGLRVPVQVRRLATPVLAAIVVLVLLATSGIGMVYAASDSLPGDPLYGVKLAGERVQLTFSPAEESDARLYMRFARERLEEARQLAEQGRGDDVETAMRGYVKVVEAASDILQRQRLAGGDTTSLSRTLRRQLEGHQMLLSRIRERVGEDVQPTVERALTASQEAARRASEPAEEELEIPPASPPLNETATPSPTETECPTETVRPKDTPQPAEREEPVDPWQPPGLTMTPQPPGLTMTPQPPGQTMTPQPPGLTKTRQPPGLTKTPQPPGLTMTPEPPGRTKTPQPPGLTMTPEPPGPPDVPGPPSSPGPPGGSEPGDASGAPGGAADSRPDP